MDNDQDIRDLIKTTPAIPPPDDFTPRVMQAVLKTRVGMHARAWTVLSQPHQFTLEPIRALRSGVGNEEISLYFMMVAFAHLTIALVLLMGLKNNGATAMPPLLRLQPWISLFLAGWLGLWGSLLKMNSHAGIKGAQFGAMLYIESLVINGVLLLMECKIIFSLILFVALIVGISVTAGIFLALACSAGTIRIVKGSPTLT
jgi:hypothetical protein